MLTSVKTENEIAPIPHQQEIKSYDGFVPKSFDDMMKISTMLSNSDFCPKDFKGKPENVFLAIQMGADLGLKPMQAIQNIAVINSRPCVWGDAALAVIKGHPEFQDIEETITDTKATCRLSRKGQTDVIRTFTMEEANAAGLVSRSSVWKQYPKRMLQMRARGFAMRDQFPDALRGISIAEEVQDYQPIEKNITPPKFTEQPLKEKNIDTAFINLKAAIESVDNFDDLRALTPELQKYNGGQLNVDQLRQLYKEKMMELKEVKQEEEPQAEIMEAENVNDAF